jgi:lysophospholipase L1-like esterase
MRKVSKKKLFLAFLFLFITILLILRKFFLQSFAILITLFILIFSLVIINLSIHSKQKKISSSQKYILVIISIILSLVILEIALTITGNILNQQKEDYDENLYTILTLGESTTADGNAYPPETSWPNQLKQILKEQHNLEVNIINKAAIGTNTAIILSNVDSYLEDYTPDLVITMMGTNDAVDYIYFDPETSQLQKFFYNLKISKLFRLISRGLKLNYNLLIFDLFESDEIKQLVEETKKLDDEFKDEEAIEKAKLALINANNKEATYHKLESLVGHDNTIMNNMINTIFSLENIKLQNFQSENHYSLMNSNSKKIEDVQKYHYNKLYDKLFEKNIKLAIMQYPMLNISDFKDYFDDEDIIFISNKDNFEIALETFNYEDLFMDRFRGVFGHATSQGNQLIALNVVDSIIEEIKASE